MFHTQMPPNEREVENDIPLAGALSRNATNSHQKRASKAPHASVLCVFEDGMGLSAIEHPEPIELADREEFD